MQNPVNTNSNSSFSLCRLDVDVTSSSLNGIEQQQINKLNYWRIIGFKFNLAEVISGFRLSQMMSIYLDQI